MMASSPLLQRSTVSAAAGTATLLPHVAPRLSVTASHTAAARPFGSLAAATRKVAESPALHARHQARMIFARDFSSRSPTGPSGGSRPLSLSSASATTLFLPSSSRYLSTTPRTTSANMSAPGASNTQLLVSNLFSVEGITAVVTGGGTGTHQRTLHGTPWRTSLHNTPCSQASGS